MRHVVASLLGLLTVGSGLVGCAPGTVDADRDASRVDGGSIADGGRALGDAAAPSGDGGSARDASPLDGGSTLADGGVATADGGVGPLDAPTGPRDAGPGPGAVTHGRDIGPGNTGYLAWRGPSGETCTEETMTVYDREVDASTLGGSATCAWFQHGVVIDADVTLTACRVDANVVNRGGGHVTLEYSVVESASPGDWALGWADFSATRCQLVGSSDGVRYGGAGRDVLIENYIRVRAQSSDDHNDGVQMYGATGGGILLRNNIDARPVGGGGGPNGAIFVADDARGEYEIRDNYLLGGAFTLRLHDSGTYRVTGNRIETGSYVYGPLSTTAAIPGAFLEWDDNEETDGTVLTP